MEANPLVEEAKNQVAVMRGPIVYCLEGQDIQGGHRINDIAIPADVQFKETKMTIDGHEMVALEAEVPVTGQGAWGKDGSTANCGQIGMRRHTLTCGQGTKRPRYASSPTTLGTTAASRTCHSGSPWHDRMRRRYSSCFLHFETAERFLSVVGATYI